ncbi:MAG TPA: response regulator [Thermoanaerobaculales bacterium]|nr:response regulator [Thermoanaerobaculales bacterium]
MGQLILNVGDLEPQRDRRSSVLRSAGFEVIEAATGAEALAAARERRPDLVLLDVRLSDADGFGVCRAIKAGATGTPLVLHVSATFRDAAARIRALDNGADGCLAEPVDADELVATARALLRLAAQGEARCKGASGEREASRRRAAEELRASRERLAQRTGHLGVYDWDLATGEVVWSEELELVYGIPAPADPAERPAAWLRLVHPDDRDRLSRETTEWLESTELEREWEYRLLRGGVEERWVAGRSLAVRDPAGRPLRVIGTNQDVTDRKHAEQQLAAQNELLSAITESIPVLLVIWDPTLNSFRLNRQAREVLGWTEDDASDGRFMERVYPNPAYRRMVSDYMLSLEPGWRDLQTTAKDGTVVDISWANVTLKGGLSVGIGVDVRERKRLEGSLQDAVSRLAEADRRKDEFLAVLSHELRNPLAPIRYAVSLLRRQPNTEPAARTLAVIERQTNQLARLVDDLLDLSRITRGTISLQRDCVALGTIITAAVEGVSAGVLAGRHALHVDVPEAPIWVHGDPARLSQVVTNLLDNSVKYTPPGGQIRVRADSVQGEAVIRVADNGIGIPLEAQGSIFDMFHRVHEDTRQGGLGIGLALCKRLVELHGGRIAVHSHGPGEGTEVAIHLPLASSFESTSQFEKEHAAPGTRRLKVLVVDDNVDLVEMLALVIEGAGHDVRKAFDGRTAVAAAVSYRPDLLLLDLGLPGMAGVDVARELRRRPETSSLHIVALTGLGQPDDRRQTQDAGFDEHLVKPTPPEEVEQLLTRLAAELPS